MKYKKGSYIIILILMLIIGIDKPYAAIVETCYYTSSDNEAMAKLEVTTGYSVPLLHGGKDYSKATFELLGTKKDSDTETILNWYANKNDTKKSGIKFEAMYKDSREANKNGKCPKYLLMRTNISGSNYHAYATNDETIAKQFVVKSTQNGKYKAWYTTYLNSAGKKITEEEYYAKKEIQTEVADCAGIFGDKENPESLSYLINEILSYPKYIVPIIVIVLGTLDLIKAVIASKEDEMKNAQKTFIQRIFIGVAVFLIPVIIDIFMLLADLVWNGMYTTCGL